MEKITSKRPSTYVIEVVERTSFFRIFTIWFMLILLFALSYHGLTKYTNENYLMGSNGSKITNLVESVYYSFITATSTGYGDIVPRGPISRTLAIVEVIVGLIMLAIITSKLVALKQEKLLEQIYHLSFSEKINRFISNFHLFGHNMDSLLYDLKGKKFDHKRIMSLSHNMTKLDQNIGDMEKMFFSENNIKISKKLSNSSILQILTGLKKSMLKIKYILKISNESELVYKRKSLSRKVMGICEESERILNEINQSYSVPLEKVNGIKSTLREIRVYVLNLKLSHKKIMMNLELNPQVIHVPEAILAE